MAENEYKPVEGLSIIGESINDSVPSTHELLEKNDIKAIKNLAVFQAEKGAAYIDVNIGRREPSLMAELIREIQSEISLPLSVDSPDPQILRAGLEAYDAEKANGKKPIVNSVSELRPEIFGLYSIQPFMPILMSSERAENGKKEQNKTGDDVYRTALNLKKAAEERCPGIENDDLIIDPGIAPIGTDFENMLKMVLDAMAKISGDPVFSGVHFSVGLSNFSVMLPSRTGSGGLVKTPLESAFITMARPLGLDFVIGSVKKKYRILDDNDSALLTLKEGVAAGGYGTIERLQDFLTS